MKVFNVKESSYIRPKKKLRTCLTVACQRKANPIR